MDELVKKNRIQCICALISCAIVVICVCIGVTMNLTTLYDEDFDNMGIRTFCMFTVNSNILAAISSFAIIPYAIDGIPFNPLIMQDSASADPWEEREAGGVGLIMVKKMASDLSYVYEDGHNLLTVTINIDLKK